MNALEQRLADLAQQLESHDWYSCYSDDHRVWSRGEAKFDLIRGEVKALKELGATEQVAALWEQFCPWSKTNSAKQI